MNWLRELWQEIWCELAHDHVQVLMPIARSGRYTVKKLVRVCLTCKPGTGDAT